MPPLPNRAKHSHKTSLAPEDFLQLRLTDGEAIEDEQQPLMSPNSRTTRKASFRRTGSSKDLPAEPLHHHGSGTTAHAHAHAHSHSHSHIDPSQLTAEAVFKIRRRRVKAWLTPTGLKLVARTISCIPCKQRYGIPHKVPYEEVISCSYQQAGGSTALCIPARVHMLVLHCVRRSRRKACHWTMRRLRMYSQDEALVKDWVQRISAATKAFVNRPRNLLVIVNPWGGAKRAVPIWRTIALPVFQLAGIECMVHETERAGHARDLVENLKLGDLQHLDGVVAVGGDGLFQEMLNGLLALRAKAVRAGEDGEATAAFASRLRLGHIPAGSTDAVAFSLNGTRSELSATLHIAIGDRAQLDVMRLDTATTHRFACCVASYGYMGDLMAQSETLRWMGPTRYNIAGAFVLFRGRAYNASVSYLPAPALARPELMDAICSSQCDLCHSVTQDRGVPSTAFMEKSPEARPDGRWKTVTGRYKSIMAVVTPCRSDRSTLGLSPFSHLADGRIHLVLVKDCSVLQYLKFMASIPVQGVIKGKFQYVDIIEVTAISVKPDGAESCWNVDGELVSENAITAQVHQGLVDVFARGVEQ